jgi:hypothetical protein
MIALIHAYKNDELTEGKLPLNYSSKYKNEIGAKQINSIHGKNKMGNRMENRERKCKTAMKHEPISRH